MKNLKVTAKLYVSFGLVLIMLIGLGGISILNMRKLDGIIIEYKDKSVVNINSIWQMRRNMVSIQRYLLMGMVTTDPGEATDYLASVKTDRQGILDNIDSIKRTLQTDPVKFDEYEKKFLTAGPYREQIEKLIMVNTPEANAQAYDIFLNQYKPIFDASADMLIGVGDAQQQIIAEQSLDAMTSVRTAFTVVIATLIVAIIVAFIMIAMLRRAIMIPVTEIEKAARAMSEGKLNAVITYSSKDELGQLADSMRHSMEIIREYIEDIDGVMSEMANNNFDVSPKKTFIGDFEGIAASMKKFVATISDTLAQIRTAAEQVSAGSDQVSSGAQALAQGATEQASSVEELSASITEISAQVRQNAEHATSAKEMAMGASNAITSSNNQMQHLMTAMDMIHAKSTEISKIIKTIEDIAFQTNILALNAAVEAARAGAAGKGFAVVADEVRNLAGKSAEAAKNTTQLIEDSVVAIDEGVKLAGLTAQELVGVVESVESTKDIIAEISSASSEQSASISQITVGIDQISAVVQTNSATSEESAAASEELSSQANILHSLISRFRLKSGDSSRVAPRSIEQMPDVSLKKNSGKQYGYSDNGKY